MYGLVPYSCQPTYDAWLTTVHPDDKEKVHQAALDALSQNKELNIEWRVTNLENGKERWLMARSSPEFNQKEKLELYRGIVIDITERKQIEQALLKKERHLSESQSVARIGSWEQNIDTGQLIWSEETYRLMGLSPEIDQPPVGEQFLELFHPDDRPSMQTWIDDCVAGKKPPALEIRTCPSKGEERWILGDGVLETDSTGKPKRMIGTAQDITDTKHLINEKQRWVDAFTYCAHGVVLGDPQSETIITCNPAFARMLGYDSPNELQGMAILELYHPERRKIQKAYIEQSDEIGHNHYETIHQSKDGVSIDVQVDLVSVKDVHGKVLYRVATIQNITEKKRAREALKQLNTELEQRVEMRTEELATLNQSLETFVYSVSHDLKTPLRGIEGYSRLLQEDFSGKLDGEGKLFLKKYS